MKRYLFYLIIFLFIFIPAGELFASDYIIGEGDVLDIAVWGVKDLNSTVKVRPDGKITIPGLGDVKASGYTPTGLQVDLKERLKHLVKSPIVTVTVREITNSKVYVFGSGVQPGIIDLNRRTTLLQLLCMISPVPGSGTTHTSSGSSGVSGGTGGQPSTSNRVPDFKKAYVLRAGKKIKEDFTRLFVNGEVSEDILIESDDSIFIPQLPESNVYVLGAVVTPRSLEYSEGKTVMEAILQCGGFTRFAKQNNVVIHRKEGEKENTFEVRVKDLMNDADLSQNVKLKPGDYIVVKEGMF